MGLGITFVLVLLAFNANCNTLDKLVQEALTYVTDEITVVDNSINENLKVQRNLQLTLRSLESTLSNAIIETHLPNYINSLESLYQMSIGTNDESCFTIRSLVLDYIRDQTSIYYKICVSRFSKTTAEDELKLSNLARTLNTTTKSLRDCGNNAAYRKNIQFGRMCVKNARASFAELIKTLNSSPASEVNQVNYIEELSKCITNTVNRGEDIIHTLNDGVADCLKRVSNNTELIQSLGELIPDPIKTQDVFKPQTLVPVSEDLKNLVISVQSGIKALRVLLASADNVKYMAKFNTSRVLSSVFNPTKDKLAQEASKFESSNDAKFCVAAFQNSLIANNESRVSQLQFCVSSAAEPRFQEISSIEAYFMLYKTADKNIQLNCMANINNIFPIGGIKTCIEDKRRDYESDLSGLDFRLGELKQQTELIEKRVATCTKLASDNGARQVVKDISTFEACIKKATENSSYKFP